MFVDSPLVTHRKDHMRLTVRSSIAVPFAASMLASVPAASAFDFGVHVFAPEVQLLAISYDGSTVCGRYLHSYGFRASQDTQSTTDGLAAYNLRGGGFYSLNDDGSVVGGSFQDDGSWNRGVVDRGPGDYTLFGPRAQGIIYTAAELSGDGQTVLLRRTSLSTSGGGEWFVLSRSDGTAIPPTPPYSLAEAWATDLSRNGNVVVGSGYTLDQSVAFRYTIGVGLEVLQSPDGGSSISRPTCVSAEGSIIAGNYTGGACFWTATGVTPIPNHPDWERAGVYEMNDDATVLIGSLANGVWPNSTTVPAIWLADGGWHVAQDYFASFGILMPEGRTIEYLAEVSSDGRTFLGSFDNEQYFVVTVPTPGAVSLLTGTMFLASRRRRVS